MQLPRTIALAVDDVARQAIGKDWGLYSALLGHWREIVGQEYAQVTTPVKVSFPKGKPDHEKWAQGQRTDGVLHIRLPQGLTMEFSFLSEQIRQRISACFGYEAIARIVFEPYYAAPDAKPERREPAQHQKADFSEAINDVDDEELRAALKNLGKVIY